MALGILMDIAGVLYDADHQIGGASQAIAEIRKAGVPMRFLTNTTRRPKRAIVERLQSFGIPADGRDILTPAEAACVWLRDRGFRPHLLVHPDLEEDFDNVPPSGPVAVVVGDAGPYFTYERMNATYRELANGAPLVALAYNRFFRDRDGELSLDAGAFVSALEFASGHTATLLGKPAKGFFFAGVQSLGLSPEQVVMIGDDAENDVAGARAAGLGGGILVQTGKYRPGDEARFEPFPTFVGANVGEAVRHALAALR